MSKSKDTKSAENPGGRVPQFAGTAGAAARRDHERAMPADIAPPPAPPAEVAAEVLEDEQEKKR